MKRIFLIASTICFFGAFVAYSTNQGTGISIVFIAIGIILLIAYFVGDKPNEN